MSSGRNGTPQFYNLGRTAYMSSELQEYVNNGIPTRKPKMMDVKFKIKVDCLSAVGLATSHI